MATSSKPQRLTDLVNRIHQWIGKEDGCLGIYLEQFFFKQSEQSHFVVG